MAEFVLKNNYFEFNSEIKHQISGTAIGTKFAPPYACIFMDRVETEFLSKESLQPWVWLRYIDDIFFVWTHGESELESFLERLNGFHPSLRFTHESSRDKISFLDVTISNDNGIFSSDLYCKPTDCHQFLDFGSSHPLHIKKSIVYSQALRIKRLCSSQRDFEKYLPEIRSWFCNRNYPETVVDKELNKAISRPRQELFERKAKRVCGVPFVVTFHPALNSLPHILKKHLHLLFSNVQVKAVFTPAPFVSFRTGYSLKNHLVRSKVYPLERVTGSLKCGKSRCKICDCVEQTNEFESTVTGDVFKINHRLCCDDRLVYLLTCKVCKIQYVGQTVGGEASGIDGITMFRFTGRLQGVKRLGVNWHPRNSYIGIF